MSPLAYRLDVDGWIVFESVVHVGALGASVEADLTLAVDGAGRHIIPGTSLAGTLRSWSEGARHEGDPIAVGLRDLWGFVEIGIQDSGSASRVLVDDAIVLASSEDIERFTAGFAADPNALPPTRLATELRDGVGIDRVTGAAAKGILYGREVLPKGTVAQLCLRLEAPADDSADRGRRLVRDLLRALADGHVRVGAASSRGLGRVRLLANHTTFTILDLRSRDAFLTSLFQPSRAPIAELLSLEGEPVAVAAEAPMRIAVQWHARQPVMVRASVDGFVVDSVPLVSGDVNGDGAAVMRPVLPGASVKGALRSTAERIVASLSTPFDMTPTAAAGDRVGFLAQLHHPGLALLRRLFGVEGRDNDTDDIPDSEQTFGRSAVSVADTYAMTAFTPHEWVQIVAPTEATGRERRLPDFVGDKGFDRADHVAIDPWTGGAAEGLLYSVLEPRRVQWHDIVIELDRSRLGDDEDEADAACGLLFAVLRELQHGRVPLGYGVNRGQGTIAVDSDLRAQFSPTDVERWSTAWQMRFLVEAPR